MTLFYNGIQYEVETEGDMEPINLLAEDELENYSQVADDSKDFQESNWTPKVMHLFLDECIKRKMLIRDPKIQRHKVFLAIHKQLKANGYIFKVITLERKLRTMKKHYMVFIENNRNPLLKRTYWQYFDKLKILFPDCLSQDCLEDTEPLTITKQQIPPTLVAATNYNKNSQPLHISSNSNTDHASQESSITQLILKNNCSSALLGLTFDRKKEMQQTEEDDKNFEKSVNIKIFRREILSLEERRTIAIEKILAELRQSNKLKEEMLELNMELFEATKQLEDYTD